MNLADAIERMARMQPWAPALVWRDGVIGFAELDERARRQAHALHALGVRRGDRVGLRLRGPASLVVSCLALARLGAACVPLSVLAPDDTLRSLLQRVRITTLIQAAGADAPGVRGIDGDDVRLRQAVPSDAAPLPPGPDADDEALIVLTSGTTGPPKAMAWSHRRLLRQWARMRSLRPHGPGVRLMVFMGLDASYALQAVLRMLLSGGAAVVPASLSLDALVEGIDGCAAQHLLSTPGLVGRLLEQLPADGPRFPLLQSVHLGGGIVSPRLHAQLRRRLAPTICTNAGSTEVGGLSHGVPGLLDSVPGSSGRVSPWVEAQAVDDDGGVLPRGESGVLRFRADDFPTGYLDGDDDGTTFREGWYYPGDRGRVLADDTLVIEGRLDELLNLGGMKLDPQRIEQVLLEDPRVHDAAVYLARAEDGRELLTAALVGEVGLEPAQALQRCRERLGRMAPTHALIVPALPRNAAGKLLRHQLARHTRIRRRAEDAPPDRAA